MNIINLNGPSNYFDNTVFDKQVHDTFDKTCNASTLILLHNFPVPISPEIKLDLIVSFSIDKNVPKNYFRQWKNDCWININNFIICICFYEININSELNIDNDGNISIDGEYFDYKPLCKTLKYGFNDYLVNRCSFLKNEFFIIPLLFIKHNSFNYLNEGIYIDKAFDFNRLLKYLMHISDESITSCRRWNSKNGYAQFVDNITHINDKASEDSKYGFITKKKIDRISNAISRKSRKKTEKRYTQDILFDDEVFEDLKSNTLNEDDLPTDTLIIFEGKAGTGKTSELIKAMIKNLRNNRSARFFTYNHLLVHDITKTLSAFGNSLKHQPNSDSNLQGYSIMTLHSFYFKLSLNLGILHLMAESRILELKKLLHYRISIAINLIKALVVAHGQRLGFANDFNILKELIGNQKELLIAEKEVAVDYINYLHKNKLSVTSNFEISSLEYIAFKIDSLEFICAKKAFITDYYEVLKNILKALNSPSDFFSEFKVGTKFKLLYSTMKYGNTYKNNEELKIGVIPRKVYIERVNRVKAGHRMGNCIVMIDEGQDCHRDEKEILYSVFKPQNLIVANGGREQLIRHVELCNWKASHGITIPHKVYITGNKSYRIKKSPLHLCNFVANKFKVEINLEPLDTEDSGELIIDFRKSIKVNRASDIFENLLLKGKLNHCSQYESLLVLRNAGRSTGTDDAYFTSAIVNEYGNIEEQKGFEESAWEFNTELAKHCEFWDGTNDFIRKHYIPSYREVRSIFYNSCRGLEAWSVACFEIDKLFDKKRAEKDAEIYLMDTFFTLEERKDMYAATWVLMALTRTIDTLYLKISDPNSKLGKVFLSYSNANPDKVKMLQD